MPKNKPQMICDNCGTLNNLDFDPRKNYKKLKKVLCKHCRRLIYNKKERREIANTKSIINS